MNYDIIIGICLGIGITHIVYVLYFHFMLLPRVDEIFNRFDNVFNKLNNIPLFGFKEMLFHN